MKRILILGSGQRTVRLLEVFSGISGLKLSVYDTSINPQVINCPQARNAIISEIITEIFIPGEKIDLVIEAFKKEEFKDVLEKINKDKIKIVDLETTDVFLEILELKIKQRKLDKSEFIANVAHELRTPLAAIRESVMLILDGTVGHVSCEQAHFLDISKRNIDRLTKLITDLFALFEKSD